MEYSDNYSKISGILWEFYVDLPDLNNNGAIVDFHEDNAASRSLNIKVKLTGKTPNNSTKNVKIMVPLKYLKIKTFWRTLEMPLINCEINLYLIWSEKYLIVAINLEAQATIFSIIDTKLYFPVVTLSTKDNTKLLEQLKSGLKGTINWNNYQSKKSIERPNEYFDYSINSSFQVVNRHVIWITYDNIPKVATGQGDNYTIDWFLDYNYFKKYYKMIAIDLSKQQALDIDPQAIQ